MAEHEVPCAPSLGIRLYSSGREEIQSVEECRVYITQEEEYEVEGEVRERECQQQESEPLVPALAELISRGRENI